MKRKTGEVITRMTTIAVLGCLGFIFMAFLRIPFPLAPWLMIEISEITVLVGYALYGFGGAFSIALIKTLLDLLINGIVGPYGIGNITAILTSLVFILAMFITSHLFKMFNKGLGMRIVAYLIVVSSVTIVMTLLNYMFITPIYITGKLTTCFDTEAAGEVMSMLADYGISQSDYFLAIFIIYAPFNLLKGTVVCVIYEALINRLIFKHMQKSEFMKKYFLGPVFKNKDKEEEKKETDSE